VVATAIVDEVVALLEGALDDVARRERRGGWFSGVEGWGSRRRDRPPRWSRASASRQIAGRRPPREFRGENGGQVLDEALEAIVARRGLEEGVQKPPPPVS
jgi:hypothetical protein